MAPKVGLPRSDAVRVFDFTLAKQAPGKGVLKRLLRSWDTVLVNYRAAQRDDNPYWYNERASVSTLAAAAWQAGGIALEEYRATKDGGRTFHGRADLWLKLDGVSFSVEAKQAWPVGPEKLVKTVDDWREDALESALAVQTVEADHRVALLFTAPSIIESKTGAFAADDWIEQAMRVESTFKAWWFLDAKRIPRAAFAESSKTGSRGYPGVLVFGWTI